MRHGKKIHKIGRDASHRKATLQSMSAALIQHKRITTTLGKARALRVFVEPILNRAKDTTTAGRREAFRHLQDKEAVKELYGSIAGAIGSRPGGYTRIVKLGQRGGDAAEMAIIELVDFNDVKPAGSAGTKRKTRRSRTRGTGDAAPTAAAAAPAATAAATAPAETPAAETSEEAPAAEAVETAPAADETDAAPDTTDDAEPAREDDPTTGPTPAVPAGPSGGAGDDAAHGDSPQGAPARTGEPNPESHATNLGRSGHRG